MKITFPHMGNLGIAVKAMFEELGREVALPPLPNKTTLQLGVKYSPEFVCLPFKLTLGNFIEAINNDGADVVAMVGGFGPCRLGYYSTIQKILLENIGYKFKMLTFEPRILDYVKKLTRLSINRSFLQACYAFWFGWRKLILVETAEYYKRKIKPLEFCHNQTETVYKEVIHEVDKASSMKELDKIEKNIKDRFLAIKLRKDKFNIRVGIVGEIYVVLEPFVNLDIINKLTNMGVEVDVAVGVSALVKQHTSLEDVQKDKTLTKKYALKMSSLYLRNRIGGEGNISVGKSIIYAQAGYDGIIHIMPFTCSPENTAQAILHRISKDYDIPILCVIVDEQTQDTALITRLEAFIELVKRKKKRKCYR